MIFRDDNKGVKGIINDFYLDQIPWRYWFYVDVTEFFTQRCGFPFIDT